MIIIIIIMMIMIMIIIIIIITIVVVVVGTITEHAGIFHRRFGAHRVTANLRTKILDFGWFDSKGILI